MATPLMFAQQIFTAFSEGAANNPCQNATVTNATIAGALSGPRALPTDIASLLSFLLSFSALGNWLKLVVFGSVLETLRRLGFYLYYKISDSFFVTAHFEDGDTCYGTLLPIQGPFSNQILIAVFFYRLDDALACHSTIVE